MAPVDATGRPWTRDDGHDDDVADQDDDADDEDDGRDAPMTLTGKLRRSPAVKRPVQALTVGYGRLTSRARMTPEFLIIGGQRCGTTSMYRTLAEHPNVLKAVKHKGIHYFDTDYQRGLDWYRAHFPLR